MAFFPHLSFEAPSSLPSESCIFIIFLLNCFFIFWLYSYFSFRIFSSKKKVEIFFLLCFVSIYLSQLKFWKKSTEFVVFPFSPPNVWNLAVSPPHFFNCTPVTHDFIVEANEDFPAFLFFYFNIWNFWILPLIFFGPCYLCFKQKLVTY